MSAFLNELALTALRPVGWTRGVTLMYGSHAFWWRCISALFAQGG